MENATNELIKRLANTRTDENLFNPYNQVCKIFDVNTAPGLRQGNLRIFLDSFTNSSTDALWVFDSADYFSTKLSGVPLMGPSSFTKVENIFGLTLHFEAANKSSSLSAVPNAHAKLWNLISKQKEHPLIWNVLPFYPHKRDDISTRREPTAQEYLKYSEFMHSVIAIYKPKSVLAVGNKAKSALDLLKIKSKLYSIN